MGWVFQDKEARVVPDRRTIMVLGSLVVGMTLISGVLLVLEPGPVTPLNGVRLQSVERDEAASPAARLFETAEPRPWQGIVIHDSGAARGSAKTLGQVHRQLGRDGLGYHFVINNGSLKRDGLIEMSDRWRRQQAGAYLTGEGSMRFNRRYIGISLIGRGGGEGFTRAQMQQLLWLVKRLQHRHDIPPRAIYVDIGKDARPAATFPHTWFRKQLASRP